ncbi:hypothetical protein EMPG_15275 [Blastomyces silverae]|uniref:Uncharacterized protein n=1 Tax=Blastomyces silverae TaxID=2060906 RepID=A0A0H1BDB3_9EURO|nr:hypothetical protein EMPG_15275 [Blastomyces silverae]
MRRVRRPRRLLLLRLLLPLRLLRRNRLGWMRRRLRIRLWSLSLRRMKRRIICWI